MLNEEKMLLEKYGRKSTFRVPEGYFDHFADTMTSRMLEGASALKPVCVFLYGIILVLSF